MQRVLGSLRQAGSVARPEFLRMLLDAGLLNPGSPQALARALPHLAARGPHLGIATMVHAAGQGSRRAVVDDRGALTWKELNARTIRVGRGFRRRGVQPGERVVLCLDGGRELVECLCAAQKAAAWAVLAGPDDLPAALADHAPRVLVYDAAHTRTVAAALETSDRRPALIAAGTAAHVRGSSAYEEVLAGSPRDEFRARPVPQPGIVVYSSAGRAAARDTAGSLAAALGFLRVIPLKRRDTVLIAGPARHGLELAILVLAVVVGATVVLPGPSEPRDLLHTLEDERVTVAVLGDGALRAAVELPGAAGEIDRSRLQVVIVPGGPVPQELRMRASNLFGPVIHDVFGTTAAGWIAIARPEDFDRKPASAGRPVPGVDVTIRSSDGTPVPFGVEGAIHVSSGLAAAATVDTERAGWIDDEGYLFVKA